MALCERADAPHPPATIAPHTVRAPTSRKSKARFVRLHAAPGTRQMLALPCIQLCELTVHCKCAGYRYQGGPGFSEMLHLEGLQSLRLCLDNPPQQLYFAEGFSKLRCLSFVELRECKISGHTPRPTFSACAFFLSSQSLHLPFTTGRHAPRAPNCQIANSCIYAARWAICQPWRCCLWIVARWRRPFHRLAW